MMYLTEHPKEPYSFLKRPATLVEGERYYLIDQTFHRRRYLKTVTFVDYTACPAVVVIADGGGIRSRCPRDQIWGLSRSSAPAQDEGSGI